MGYIRQKRLGTTDLDDSGCPDDMSPWICVLKPEVWLELASVEFDLRVDLFRITHGHLFQLTDLNSFKFRRPLFTLNAVHLPEQIFLKERLTQILSRQWVPCGDRVLMLVNWVDGTRALSFSFLSTSNCELWGGQLKSPSTTSCFSAVASFRETEHILIFCLQAKEDGRSKVHLSLSIISSLAKPCASNQRHSDMWSLQHWPLSVSWILGGSCWILTSSLLRFLLLDSAGEAVAWMWTFTSVSSNEPTCGKHRWLDSVQNCYNLQATT